MNKVFLNTIGEKVIVKGGGSGGGSGYKYYDAYKLNVNNPDSPIFSLAKTIKYELGGEEHSLMYLPNILPFGRYAIEIDTNKKYRWYGEEVTAFEIMSEMGLAEQLNDLTEIDQNEFYYTPQEEIWDCTTEEGCKSAYDKLQPIIQKYGVDLINEAAVYLSLYYSPLIVRGSIGDSYVTHFNDIVVDGDNVYIGLYGSGTDEIYYLSKVNGEYMLLLYEQLPH